MKRMIYILMPVLVLGLAVPAFAAGKNVTTVEGNKDTLQVTVSGSVDLDYIHREDVLNEALTGDQSESNLVEGEVVISLNADLSNNVKVIVDLKAYRVFGGTTLQYGENNEESDLYVERACVAISEFIDPAIALELGVVDPAFGVSSMGGKIFDPRRSASITTGLSAGATGLTAGQDELQPTGMAATYTRDKLTLSVVALPAIVEAGAGDDNDDEAAYGAMFTYDMAGQIGACGEGSQIAGMFMLHNAQDSTGSGTGSEFFTVGGGINLVGVAENLDVFGEVYFQFGDVGDDLDAGGMAFQAGAQLNMEGDNKPYIRGILTYLSGDDDATDEDEDGFLSYESISDLLILEDQYFGVNIRNNYMAIKGIAGLTTELAGNEVELKGVIGFAQTNEEVNDEDALGVEVDVLATLHLNGQTSLTAGLAFLSGSDVMEQLLNEEEDSTWLFTLGVNAAY